MKAPFSNFGSLVDVAAPGVELASTFPGNQYATWSGTSFATPLVAATAALVVSEAAFGRRSRHRLRDAHGHRDVDSGGWRGRQRQLPRKDRRPRRSVTASTSSACDASAYDKIDLRAVDPTDRRSDGEAERDSEQIDQEFEVVEGWCRGLRIRFASRT